MKRIDKANGPIREPQNVGLLSNGHKSDGFFWPKATNRQNTHALHRLTVRGERQDSLKHVAKNRNDTNEQRGSQVDPYKAQAFIAPLMRSAGFTISTMRIPI